MITIVEPKQHIDKLWGKQRIREDETYRLMKYVLRVDHEGKVLLHNVVTGQLVALEREEAAVLDKLPTLFTREMEPLVTEHYLVPDSYDEFCQVSNLKKILRKLDNIQEPCGTINHYTILPTTACNARCYYCFEQGAMIETMSEKTADDVVDFIRSHCGDNSVRLSWFGGEPTLTVNRINQICKGLQSSGIKYWSEITTNGYLFDEALVEKAEKLWKLKSAMICVDGTEDSYNKTKCYIYSNCNPYQTVMRNIGLLLNRNIRVHLRMNFDIGNYTEFADLVKEACGRYQGSKYLVVTAHPLIGEYKDYTGHVRHGSEAWFEEKLVELNDLANSAGVQRRKLILPSLDHCPCMAARASSITITPRGNLVSCPEQFGEEQIKGNLVNGVTNNDLDEAWKTVVTFEKCRDCVAFPHCVMVMNCRNAGNCLGRDGKIRSYKSMMLQCYNNYEWTHKCNKGGKVL